MMEIRLALVLALVSELGSATSELRVGFTSERFRTRGQKPPLGIVEIHPTLGNIGNPIRFQRTDEDHFEVSETLTLPMGNHSLKSGFNLSPLRQFQLSVWLTF